ncbi:MAG: hypothetical protein ABR500_06785 [Dermatophilaceae bacterium]|nr:hypothetical protein [Intrasporangiaceae bacterium]
MKLYADLPPRRTRQILADALMLVWVVTWVVVARAVHEMTMTLAVPGRALQDAGGSFRDRMLGAGDRVDDLPLLQDRLAEPFRDVSGVGTDIASAGTDLVTAAERVALVAGLTTALIPITIVGAVWLALRLRWIRRATTTARFIDSTDDLDLFALRALAHQPMTALARISEDPSGAWRRGDATVITALAELELADTGLRLPSVAGG